MLDPSAPLPPSGIAGFADVDATPDPAAYVAFLDGFQRGLAPMIEAGIDLLRLELGASVLDVGCGHGAVFERLAARIGAAGRIAGLDSSRTLLEEARRRCDHRSLGAELHEGDAHQLPFNDAVFDATRADRVLIFLHNPRVALVEMARVTRPGGRIVVTEADLGSAIVDAPDPELTRTLLATAAEAVPGALDRASAARALRRYWACRCRGADVRRAEHEFWRMGAAHGSGAGGAARGGTRARTVRSE